MDSMSLLSVAIIINDSGSVLSDGHGIIINWAITICLPSIQQKVNLNRKLHSHQPLVFRLHCKKNPIFYHSRCLVKLIHSNLLLGPALHNK